MTVSFPFLDLYSHFIQRVFTRESREESKLLTLGCTELSHVQVGLSSGRHFEYQFLKKQRTFCQGISVLNALWMCPVLISEAGRMSWELVCHFSGSLEEFRDTKSNKIGMAAFVIFSTPYFTYHITWTCKFTARATENVDRQITKSIKLKYLRNDKLSSWRNLEVRGKIRCSKTQKIKHLKCIMQIFSSQCTLFIQIHFMLTAKEVL